MPPRHQRDSFYVCGLAAAASLVSFLCYYRHDALLLYGDAVAHMHIARRVVDSLTPGPLRLGTVWLPLPHVLLLPLVMWEWMWRSGVAGSPVSMAAYVLGALGVFRLARGRNEREGGGGPRQAAWIAVLIYAANPNLIYLQATAMTEALYLALAVWAIVFLTEFVQGVREEPAGAARALERCAMLLSAAMLTRYDGWLLAFSAVLVVLGLAFRRWRSGEGGWPRPGTEQTRLRRALRNFLLLVAAVPTLWLAYNFHEYRNPLEFATGPYSARGIETRLAPAGAPYHPGYSDPRLAAIYFLKCAKLNLGEGRWELPLLLLAVAGSLLTPVLAQRHAAALLLWLPLPFYALSVAYGGVPIFLPVWWPFSYYNVRYGLQLLPAVAVFAGVGFELAWRAGRRPLWRGAVTVAVLAVVAGSYASVWIRTPICLREAYANSRTRIPFEEKLGDELARLPQGARLLMYTADHPGALRRAGIPLRRVINESNHPQWEQALAAPTRHADYLVALAGDPVFSSATAHPESLETVAVVDSPGQPRAVIYRAKLPSRP